MKRGRPPLQRNQQSESSIPSTPNSPSLLQPSPYSLLLQPTNDKITKPDKNALYCICKSPYDGTRFMIACDKCDQWFHGECIGISEKQGEFIDLYFCDDCAKSKYQLIKKRKRMVRELICMISDWQTNNMET